MDGASQHVHSQHGSGAVNLVVSRESGGAVRAPGNAGDKRVKRKRGSRFAAAIAARIERGYLKRTRTAGGTACVNNHVDSEEREQMAAAIPAAERTSTAARERESLARTPGQRVRAGVVDTRVIGKPDQFDGNPMKYAGWSFTLRSYLGAVDQRYQQELTTTETSSTPRLNATLGSDEIALSTQMYYILVMPTAGAALDKCHNAGVNEGFEAWRQFVMEWEPKLPTRYVGLLMNVLEYRFRDDIPTKLASFERTVHDYEDQSTKTVDDDIKIGVTMLGMEDMRVKEHLIRNSVRIASWNQMREEILEITRTQQYVDSQPMPMQLGANPKSKGKGKNAKANESSKKAKNDDQRKCFYCNKSGHVKAECRNRQKDLADAEGRPVAASPHPNDTAAVVPLQCLLPDERHTSTFVIAMHCANTETSCESSSEQAVRSPGACGIAPAETHVRPIAAIPSNLMMDTCARAIIFQEVLIRALQTTRRWHQCNSRRRQTIRCTGVRERNHVLV